ncbi:MAG: cyclic nucleotide-binding domain-containing protein [Deltaproteobacteria bacterium]|nr:cyclic nucleotide-binding domain-containing protein [Deltaproteobacteria bacterium]
MPWETSDPEIQVTFLDADDGIALDEQLEEPKLDLALLRRLPAIPLFADMPEGAFFELTTRMRTLRFAAGDVVAREGDPPGSLFVVIDGSVMVKVGDDEVINRLGEGDVFGEMSLLLDGPRRASIVADSSLEIFELDRELLNDVIDRYPAVADVLARLVKSRLVDLLLATAPIFTPFDGPSRRDLVRRFELREVAPGTRLITEGLPGDGLYVVVSGSFEVRRGDELVLARLVAGDVFGEISLLTHGEAVATVEALAPSMVLRLPRRGFQETIVLYPPVLEHIAQLAAERGATEGASDGSLVFT